jgi:hypothetical protein
MHTCVDDKVCLIFKATLMPGNPITSKNLAWIREHSAVRAVAPLSTFNVEFGALQPDPRDGVLTVLIPVRMLGVAVAREVARYPGAVEMMKNHERKHMETWDDAMGPFLEGWGNLLEEQIHPPERPYASLVHRILIRQVPRLRDCLNRSTQAWDRQDWPQLHRALQRVGVPPDFCMTTGDVQIVLGDAAIGVEQGAYVGAGIGQ